MPARLEAYCRKHQVPPPTSRGGTVRLILESLADSYCHTLRELEQVLGIELDGLLGSGVLSAFRVTLADQGRTMWLEQLGPPEDPQAAP